MTSSPELPHCDTELSLGSPTRELKQKQKQAPATPCCCGGGLTATATATELQAMAILQVARLAAKEGAAGLSMRRSMEWFLQRRREARRQRVRGAAASASPSSSSSFSYLTDSSRN